MKQNCAYEHRISIMGATSSDQGSQPILYGLHRLPPSGSVPVDMVFVNARPVPLHAMFSTCQSAHIALIFARLLCVPPVAFPPGTLVAWPPPIPTTVTFGLATKLASLVVLPTPWNRTAVEVLSCAGANTIKTVGLEILSAEIPTTPDVALIP